MVETIIYGAIGGLIGGIIFILFIGWIIGAFDDIG